MRAIAAAAAVFSIAVLAGPTDRLTLHAGGQAAVASAAPPAPSVGVTAPDDQEPAPADLVRMLAGQRLQDDLETIKEFRPGYDFWRHIFTIPDGSIAFGSAEDGRLLAVVPVRGDWTDPSVWKDRSLAFTLANHSLPRRLSDRRDLLAELLEAEVGRIVHNPTRGRFLSPNIKPYAGFLDEWAAIYERFAVPAEIGLAQALVDSGLNGTIRSEARAVGLCQWLAGNWKRLQRLAPNVIEGHNQTTQASYCAAYLTILATKYGSFIPALSEHHAGGTNVGRNLINGERLGGKSTREQYFVGAEFTRYLRLASPRKYRDIYGTYGPRSYYYAEMVFGNTANVRHLRETVEQQKIYAMRVPRTLPLAAITSSARMSAAEVKRFNPALVRQVPAGATLYLPRYLKAFGRDVSFWHRPPAPDYVEVLRDFLSLDASPAEWDDPAFEQVLRAFAQRFDETRSEEGAVMSTVLAYTIEDLFQSRRGAILAEFRSSDRIRSLFEEAVLARAEDED
jgi:hypothetical protein